MSEGDALQVESGEDDDGEYYVLPEEAFKFLPEEWRGHFQAIAEDGRAVLKSVDEELSHVVRISNSFATLVSLKHVRQRLADYRFAADMEVILELEMLTTAFIVTYVRLHQRGVSSGFSRDALPARLRPFHDEIIELRNKRFAHNAGHHSVENAMEVRFADESFQIVLGFSFGLHLGGANEWHELVDFIEQMMMDRLQKLLVKLTAKTGRNWTWPAPINAS